MANVQSALPRRRISMAQRLAFIVGSICIVGFIIDILVIGLPPSPLAPQWRLNFLQQVSERSLLLFIGSVLLLYSKLDGRLRQLRIGSIACLVVGLLVGLSSLLVIEDNLTLQRQANINIDTQAAELRARIVQGREDASASQKISPDAFSEALRSVQTQAASLKQDTQVGAMKTLISSAGNLFVVGAGLIGVGRLGLLKSFHPYRAR